MGGGAALIRKTYADLLRSLATVVIVTPAYNSNEIVLQNEKIAFPYNTRNGLVDTFLQYARIKEDYLDKWVKQSFVYLRDVVSKEDIIFSVVGGDLASVKLGALLKREVGCRLVVNFRDPVDGIKIFEEKIPFYYGLCRDKLADKYIGAADLLITSSETYRQVLMGRYPEKWDRVYNHYIGYLRQVDIKPKKYVNKPFNIVSCGTITKIQNADILYKAFRGNENFKITYIGREAAKMKNEMPEDNIVCMELMPHGQFLKYMMSHADAGFVGLKGKYLGVCVPSRVYEFLNLGLPILAALPDGSAKDIINKNEYGIACSDDDTDALVGAATRLTDEEIYRHYMHSIQKDRDQWYFCNRKEEFLDIIRNFIKIR